MMFLEKIMRHIFIWYNNELYKRNRCTETRNFSIQHNKQNNEMFKEKEVSRLTYCDEFDNTVNEDIQ